MFCAWRAQMRSIEDQGADVTQEVCASYGATLRRGATGYVEHLFHCVISCLRRFVLLRGSPRHRRNVFLMASSLFSAPAVGPQRSAVRIGNPFVSLAAAVPTSSWHTPLTSPK